MNILLTNDDGFDSPGLGTLARELRSRLDHDVYVCAPDRNRSGASHGLMILNDKLDFKETGKNNYSLPGLPSDCVIAAILGGFPCKPDMVISGINSGANTGNDIIYSGTCAAARQAAMCGVPGMALSLCGKNNFDFVTAAAYTADHLDEFLSVWREDVFLNINFPNLPSYAGVELSWPSVKNYNDSVIIEAAGNGGKSCTLVMGKESVKYEPGSDDDAVLRGFVSLSPVCVYPVVRRDLCPGAPDNVATGKRDAGEFINGR